MHTWGVRLGWVQRVPLAIRGHARPRDHLQGPQAVRFHENPEEFRPQRPHGIWLLSKRRLAKHRSGGEVVKDEDLNTGEAHHGVAASALE